VAPVIVFGRRPTLTKKLCTSALKLRAASAGLPSGTVQQGFFDLRGEANQKYRV